MNYILIIIIYFLLCQEVITYRIVNRNVLINWIKSQRLSDWYSDWEMCILNRQKYYYVVKDSLTEMIKCSKKESRKRQQGEGLTQFMKRQKLWERPIMRCHLGNPFARMSINSPVNIQLLYHLSYTVEGYDDSSQLFLKDFMKNIYDSNGVILMMGDSSIRQLLNFMTCEEEREGIIPMNKIMYRKKIPVEGGEVDIVHETVHKFKSKGLQLLRNHSLNIINEKKKSLFIILNSGLWYNEESEFLEDIDNVFKELNNIVHAALKQKRHIAIVWLESTAQHFATSSGYYDVNSGHVKPFAINATCNPLPVALNREDEYKSDWRNDHVWKKYVYGPFGDVIAKMKTAMLGVLNSRALTRDLYDVHIREGKNHSADCTHFMYTPLLYQYLFQQLLNYSLIMKEMS